MTGGGFRTFTAGEVLTAANVQDYLMDQAVMNFAGTAARGSALPSPSEGMFAHIGGGTLTVYDGAGWAQVGGGAANTAGTVKTDTFTTTAGTYVDVTGLSCTITPSSVTAKILVFTSLYMNSNPSFGRGGALLLRGSTILAQGDAAGNRTRAAFSGGARDTQGGWSSAYMYIDTPGVTTATTYKVQITAGTSTGTQLVNRVWEDQNDNRYIRTTSVIYALEL